MIVISHPDTGEDVEGEVPEGKFLCACLCLCLCLSL